MDKTNLIILKSKILFEIFNEIEEVINFKITEISNEKALEEKNNITNNCLVLTQKAIDTHHLQIVLDNLPIKISELLEKANVKLIKSQFNQKSELNIAKYKLDLNSRELIGNHVRLKLTEKEANIIIYLYNSKTEISVDKLLSEVWGYNSGLETHTVETHIYRLRKKLLEKFNDNDFIKSRKNGYQIKQ